MKTRDEVEELKREWRKDPCFDIEETTGFEHYHNELKLFRLEVEAENRKRFRREDILASGLLPCRCKMPNRDEEMAGYLHGWSLAGAFYKDADCGIEPFAIVEEADTGCIKTVPAYLVTIVR